MLSIHDVHPSPELLHDYGLGKLDDSVAERVAQQLVSCPECRQQVAGLSGDSFLDRLRQANSPASTPFAGKSLAPLSNAMHRPAAPAGIVHTLPAQLLDNEQYEILRELGAG